MAEQETSFGQIEISPAAVATIVSQSVHQCYGVVGMASKGFVNGIAERALRSKLAKMASLWMCTWSLNTASASAPSLKASKTVLNSTSNAPLASPSKLSMSMYRACE
ncbi:MAG: Asp23/Gls24 family envelope stress response protein [Chloroflexi bacterium]|nr:Asp23/Gls24 family envelope stress response protein [Chloroflexota bacterium]